MSKGNWMNLYPGTVTLRSAILALRTNEICSLLGPIWMKSSVFLFDVLLFFKGCSYEHMNKRKCEHVWEQPRSLAAFFFFYIQLMIVFFFCKAACWRSFLCIMLTTVSSISLIDAAKWQTELTDCLTVILRMMSPVDLFLDLTFSLPRPASTITPEDWRTTAFRAPSAVSRIKTPMHVTYLLTGCLHF